MSSVIDTQYTPLHLLTIQLCFRFHYFGSKYQLRFVDGLPAQIQQLVHFPSFIRYGFIWSVHNDMILRSFLSHANLLLIEELTSNAPKISKLLIPPGLETI